MNIVRIITISAALFGLSACDDAAKQAVRDTLIDPGSAQFKDMRQCPDDRNITLGEVNGKNRLGAYTGFKPFFYESGRVYFAGDAEFVSTMNRCYGKLVSKGGIDDNSLDTANVNDDGKLTGAWNISRDVNPVDDSKTVTAVLDSSEGQSSRGNRVTLFARCKSNKTEMYVDWNDYLGDDSNDVYEDWKYVTMRVGKEKAAKQRWPISTDNEATFAPGNTLNLLRRMAEADTLVLETTPYNESPTTAVFNLAGAKEAISAVAEQCNWKL